MYFYVIFSDTLPYGPGGGDRGLCMFLGAVWGAWGRGVSYIFGILSFFPISILSVDQYIGNTTN